MRAFICFIVLLGMLGLVYPERVKAQTPPPDIPCAMFPANNIWNTRVDTLPVDPNSAAYIGAIGVTETLFPDFGSGEWPPGSGQFIGIPYTVVPSTQPLVNIFYYDSPDESEPGPFPIPPNAPIEAGSDDHVLVVDGDNCILYELYGAIPQPDGSWHASSGAVFDLNSHALRPDGWTSADAAGLPLLPGLVRYEEILAGAINHAIRFTIPVTQDAYIWPGRHEASSNNDTQYPPLGQRFRLRADFDISSFHPTVQIILRAMKEYGIILADHGSAMFISGVPDSRWNNSILDQLEGIAASNFEAVNVCSLVADPNSGQAVPGASTATSCMTLGNNPGTGGGTGGTSGGTTGGTTGTTGGDSGAGTSTGGGGGNGSADNGAGNGTSSVAGNIGVFDPGLSKLGLLLPGQTGVQGEQIEWVITVFNKGSVPGQQLVIKDTLPDSLRLDRVEAPGATVITSKQTVFFQIPVLNPGQSLQFSVFTTSLQGVQVTNTACLTATNLAQEICTSIQAVGVLPRTGESPYWQRWLLPVTSLGMACATIMIFKKYYVG